MIQSKYKPFIAMQKLSSKRAQLIGSLIGIIIWFILTLSLLYAFFTDQFPTVVGKVTSSILIIIGLFFLVSNVRFYLKNRDKKSS